MRSRLKKWNLANIAKINNSWIMLMIYHCFAYVRIHYRVPGRGKPLPDSKACDTINKRSLPVRIWAP